jgi:hypothetical protein
MLAGVARQMHSRFWHGQRDGHELAIWGLFNNFNHIWRTQLRPML